MTIMSSEPQISIARLRSTRLLRGWSLDELAEKMTAGGKPISRQALHQFETGKNSPAPATFRALATALACRPSDLIHSAFSLEFVAFRKTSKLGKGAQESVKAEFSWKAECRQRLLQTNGIALRPWSLQPRRVDTVEGAEEIARWVRDEWRLGRDAISSLTDACEHNGIEILRLKSPVEGFSGLSAFESQTRAPFIALQPRPQDGARQRMDLAHELAHLVLDKDSAADEEDFAKRFAGALLLPAETVQKELGPRRVSLSFPELRALKARYGVSMQGWARRAKDLHIISESAYKALCFQFGRLKMRTDEGEPYVPPEPCDRDQRLAARAVSEGLLDAEEAGYLSGVAPSEFANREPVAKRRKLSALTRNERREAAKQAARLAAKFNEEYPEDRIPDVVDDAD